METKESKTGLVSCPKCKNETVKFIGSRTLKCIRCGWVHLLPMINKKPPLPGEEEDT